MRGFSLVETMVIVMVMSVTISVGVLQFSTLTRSYNRFNARNFLIGDLKRAQAQTITEGCRGIFSVDADGNGYSFGCDYLSYDEAETPVADTVTFRRNLPERITLASNAPIIFDSRGHSVDIMGIVSNVTLTLSENAAPFLDGELLGTGVFDHD